MRRITMLLIVIAAALPISGPAHAETVPHLEYSVLTPAGYQTSGRSYPVVYAIPGSGTGSASAVSMLGLQSYADQGEAIIVVAAEIGDGRSNFIVDWHDGTKPLDTIFTQQLVKEIDDSYRTLPDGRHRAIFGWSAGGYSATAIASRHPDMFATTASFSGVTDIAFAGPPWQVAFEAGNAFFYGEDTAMRRWGNPLTDDAYWHAQNPADLAPQLKGKEGVYIAAGDGTPSSVQEVQEAGESLVPQAALEHLTWQMTRSYDQRLTAAGVDHIYRPHAGLHRAPHWRQDLALWWPIAMSVVA